ncbi:helix-turn-helix domain-containing protein [Nocardia sp. NPDC088792]|uniref:helix-turn-helix domain-containing protein n=1 Tax=Nocardia sp. NPDC088792 TaxID=3364332 RepID=UPI00381F80B2
MSWEVARPSRALAVRGLDMAGFRIHGGGSEFLRAIPHPAVTVLLEFGEGRFDIQDPAGRTRTGSLALGLLRDAVPLRVEALECVQVRMSPLAASAVLGMPPSELSGTMVGLDELWGRDVARLCERLHEMPCWQERFALIEATLAARLRDDLPADPEVAWAWRRIAGSHGRYRIEQLASEIGWSRQRLWSRFGAQIGLTPKRAARLVRFDHAVHRLVRGQAPARVAADTGYTDQSHLHRDVREFTGAPPASAAAEPFLTVDDRAWPSTGG